jgi:hypothetical protein
VVVQRVSNESASGVTGFLDDHFEFFGELVVEADGDCLAHGLHCGALSCGVQDSVILNS